MKLNRFLPISILLTGLLGAFFFGWTEYISLETIRTNKEELKQLIQAKYATSVFIFILIYAVTTACSNCFQRNIFSPAKKKCPQKTCQQNRNRQETIKFHILQKLSFWYLEMKPN